jgi:hypothetical protein
MWAASAGGGGGSSSSSSSSSAVHAALAAVQQASDLLALDDALERLVHEVRAEGARHAAFWQVGYAGVVRELFARVVVEWSGALLPRAQHAVDELLLAAPAPHGLLALFAVLDARPGAGVSLVVADALWCLLRTQIDALLRGLVAASDAESAADASLRQQLVRHLLAAPTLLDNASLGRARVPRDDYVDLVAGAAVRAVAFAGALDERGAWRQLCGSLWSRLVRGEYAVALAAHLHHALAGADADADARSGGAVGVVAARERVRVLLLSPTFDAQQRLVETLLGAPDAAAWPSACARAAVSAHGWLGTLGELLAACCARHTLYRSALVSLCSGRSSRLGCARRAAPCARDRARSVRAGRVGRCRACRGGGLVARCGGRPVRDRSVYARARARVRACAAFALCCSVLTCRARAQSVGMCCSRRRSSAAHSTNPCCRVCVCVCGSGALSRARVRSLAACRAREQRLGMRSTRA